MIKFKNTEQAITMAIQVFDETGHVDIDDVGVIDTENVKDLLEESSYNRKSYDLIEKADQRNLYDLYHEAYMECKIRVITEAVNTWWAGNERY
jgi:hypothetical protein